MKFRVLALFILFISILLLLIACKKNVSADYQFPDPSTLPAGLKGTWLERTIRIDTLVFSTLDNKDIIVLKSNLNNINFVMFYPYEISQDSIMVSDPTSSTTEIANGINFYFNFNDSLRQMTIGNFTIRLRAKNPILIFKKIK